MARVIYVGPTPVDEKPPKKLTPEEEERQRKLRSELRLEPGVSTLATPQIEYALPVDVPEIEALPSLDDELIRGITREQTERRRKRVRGAMSTFMTGPRPRTVYGLG